MHVPVEQRPFSVSPAPPSPEFHWGNPPTPSPLQHERNHLHAHTKHSVYLMLSNDRCWCLRIKRRDPHRCSPAAGRRPADCLRGCWPELWERTEDWGWRTTKYQLVTSIQEKCVAVTSYLHNTYIYYTMCYYIRLWHGCVYICCNISVVIQYKYL